MAANYSLSIDLPNIGNMAFGRDALPHLAQAVMQAAANAHELWLSYARGMPMPNGQTIRNSTGEYLRSINLRTTGDFSAEVYSDLPYASIIEDGALARDLKDILNTSFKVRISKKGLRYLIIPFRHNTPGAAIGNAMPQNVYDWWQKKSRARSFVVSAHKRLSGTGAFDIATRQPVQVDAWKYSWGTQLKKADLEGLGVTGSAARRMAGMVRFRTDPKKGVKRSGYITFRVMVEGSKGWKVAARAGKHPAQQVAREIEPLLDDLFKAALEKDLAAVLGGLANA